MTVNWLIASRLRTVAMLITVAATLMSAQSALSQECCGQERCGNCTQWQIDNCNAVGGYLDYWCICNNDLRVGERYVR
jgi:hypothetical protein